jgi:hypothetical protein
MSTTLEQAMSQSEHNSALTVTNGKSIVVDGRCAANGDFWTILSSRTANKHYGSLEAVKEDVDHRSFNWKPYSFY